MLDFILTPVYYMQADMGKVSVLARIRCRKNNEFQGENNMGIYVATKDSIERKWLLIDAEGKTLGRLATEVAKLLRGKHKPKIGRAHV